MLKIIKYIAESSEIALNRTACQIDAMSSVCNVTLINYLPRCPHGWFYFLIKKTCWESNPFRLLVTIVRNIAS